MVIAYYRNLSINVVVVAADAVTLCVISDCSLLFGRLLLAILPLGCVRSIVPRAAVLFRLHILDVLCGTPPLGVAEKRRAGRDIYIIIYRQLRISPISL